MQKYIDQLVEDLDMVAKNPPPKPYIEVPPNLEDAPEIAELAISPFKSIEEITGINEEAFPPMIDLTADQCRQVNEAILKVFDSLKIELVDAPESIPPEWLYDVLTTNWQHPVQYLPSSGMDLEFCTGDPMTCPYGMYCDCGEDFEEIELPPRFEKLLPEIAETINMGFLCFLNPDTLEMEHIPEMLIDDPDEMSANAGIDQEVVTFKYKNWETYYVFKPLSSHESFETMEAFVLTVEDDKFSKDLLYALNYKRPFAHFKDKIDQSPYRQDWFDFKKLWLEQHVKQILWSNINDQLSDDLEESDI